jgi:hypothetical protein
MRRCAAPLRQAFATDRELARRIHSTVSVRIRAGYSDICMLPSARILPGLPPYGPIATAFPSEWGRVGREGTVVEFATDEGKWVGNFRPGLGGLTFASLHPNKLDMVVISAGDLWVVRPRDRTALQTLLAIDAILEVRNPEGWVFSRQGLALARLESNGFMWHTRRLSWDGFDQLHISGEELRGLAWSPVDDKWCPFSVELKTGKSTGGSYFDSDVEGWETLSRD